jgi:hypothetical protein
MKNTTIVAVFCFFPILVFCQNSNQTKPVATQSNGVIIHESAGNEGFVQPVTTVSPEVRTIADWTLPECIEALRIVDEKMAKLTESEEDLERRRYYLEQRSLIVQQKEYLLNNAR